MPHKEREWLSTGQAAKLFSVTSDTVLKWIRKGRLGGVRTAGGHYRVRRRDVVALLGPCPPAGGSSPEPRARVSSPPLRCWEYLTGRDGIRDECKQCSIYQVRAGWCFEMAGMGFDIGHSKQLCRSSCRDCVYYRRVKNLPTQVLVVTPDEELARELRSQQNADLALRLAGDGYEAASIIPSFRPAFAVIDEALNRTGDSGLVHHLARDSRLPGLKTILAVPKRWKERGNSTKVFGVPVSIIEKPFDLRQIAEIIARFPVESLETPDADPAGGSANGQRNLRTPA